MLVWMMYTSAKMLMNSNILIRFSPCHFSRCESCTRQQKCWWIQALLFHFHIPSFPKVFTKNKNFCYPLPYLWFDDLLRTSKTNTCMYSLIIQINHLCPIFKLNDFLYTSKTNTCMYSLIIQINHLLNREKPLYRLCSYTICMRTLSVPTCAHTFVYAYTQTWTYTHGMAPIVCPRPQRDCSWYEYHRWLVWPLTNLTAEYFDCWLIWPLNILIAD